MKAKIKATGEILEILDIGVSGKYFYLSNDKKYSRNELEFLSETIDWQHYRIQASIAAMSIVADDGYNVRNEQHLIAKYAVQLADALMAELKHNDDVYAECRKMDAINTAAVCENMTKLQNELQKKEGEND